MKTLFTVLFLGASVAFAQGALAAGQATPDEAKAMAIRAADYLKANGPEKAWAAFNAAGGDFHDRDLYVTAQGNNCDILAHGASPALIGKSLCSLKDVDGKAFVKEFSDVKDQAWIDYKWQNPSSKAVEPKTAYVVRVGDYVVAVGAYK
ncbi:MAG TPA: cache domain-containing protein [Stellaceae bacterium]|nr:cache domain-containing protein [Stellaceae bacterium]